MFEYLVQRSKIAKSAPKLEESRLISLIIYFIFFGFWLFFSNPTPHTTIDQKILKATVFLWRVVLPPHIYRKSREPTEAHRKNAWYLYCKFVLFLYVFLNPYTYSTYKQIYTFAVILYVVVNVALFCTVCCLSVFLHVPYTNVEGTKKPESWTITTISDQYVHLN